MSPLLSWHPFHCARKYGQVPAGVLALLPHIGPDASGALWAVKSRQSTRHPVDDLFIQGKRGCVRYLKTGRAPQLTLPRPLSGLHGASLSAICCPKQYP